MRQPGNLEHLRGVARTRARQHRLKSDQERPWKGQGKTMGLHKVHPATSPSLQAEKMGIEQEVDSPGLLGT